MSAADEPWHLDKRVPLALIVSLSIQTAAMVWWAATTSARIEGHERRLIAVEATARAQAEDGRKSSEALVRLDERVAGQTAILRRIEEQLARRPAQ